MEVPMRKILLIGKMNEMVKDLNMYLSKCFQVQLCSPNTEAMMGILSVAQPELVLISLIGVSDIAGSMFVKLQDEYPDTPVLTIGTERERSEFLKYFEDEQFENLIRPLENSDVQEAIVRRLGMTKEELEEAAQATEAPDGRNMILIVDDNAATLRSIKGMLEDKYKVVMAPSGIKAMTLIGKKRPDLILLDYEMPVVDGRQTLEMIRADEELQSIPVIFLTGIGDREHIEAVLNLRPAGYMLKPAIKEKLIAEIEKALAK